MEFKKNYSKYWDIKFLRFKKIYYPPILIEEKDRKFIELIKNIENKTVLKTDLFEEVHGSKNLLYKLSRKNYGIGIDISKKIIKNLRNDKEPYCLVNSNVSKLPFKDEIFDIIISTSTIDHLITGDLMISFKELNRVLKKNGSIFLTLDNYHNILYRIEFVFWKVFNLYYRVKCFKINEIKQLANKSNLHIENLESIMVFPPLIDKLLILSQNILGINLDKLFYKILKLSIKLGKSYKYTSGRFIFAKLTKQ